MNKSFVRLLCASAVALSIFASAGAQAKPAKAVVCPVCKMPLSAKKTKMNTVAVRLTKKGKVMYCCAGCKMPASVLVKKGKG